MRIDQVQPKDVCGVLHLLINLESLWELFLQVGPVFCLALIFLLSSCAYMPRQPEGKLRRRRSCLVELEHDHVQMLHDESVQPKILHCISPSSQLVCHPTSLATKSCPIDQPIHASFNNETKARSEGQIRRFQVALKETYQRKQAATQNHALCPRIQTKRGPLPFDNGLVLESFKTKVIIHKLELLSEAVKISTQGLLSENQATVSYVPLHVPTSEHRNRASALAHSNNTLH
jgi:hypothetical protein